MAAFMVIAAAVIEGVVGGGEASAAAIPRALGNAPGVAQTAAGISPTFPGSGPGPIRQGALVHRYRGLRYRGM